MFNGVFLIAAVGRSGQIGLNGKLPWHDKEDLHWFKAMTMGQAVIVGYNTSKTLPTLPGRSVFTFDSRRDDPRTFIESIITVCPGKRIYVAGGAKTYIAFKSMYRRSIITHIDYDGPADVYFPDLFAKDEMPAAVQELADKTNAEFFKEMRRRRESENG